MEKPNIHHYPKIVNGKHQYFQDDIEKYIDFLESKERLRQILLKYEIESSKLYPYNEEVIELKISNFLKIQENANK